MDPGSLVYRSPVYRQLQGLDAEFAEINAYAVAINIGEPESLPEAKARRPATELTTWVP